MAIFVTQDDAGGEPDHVDAQRSVLLVISPWAKRGYVSHRHTTIVSMHRTLYQIFGLPPLNMFDALANDFSDCFTTSPTSGLTAAGRWIRASSTRRRPRIRRTRTTEPRAASSRSRWTTMRRWKTSCAAERRKRLRGEHEPDTGALCNCLCVPTCPIFDPLVLLSCFHLAGPRGRTSASSVFWTCEMAVP